MPTVAPITRSICSQRFGPLRGEHLALAVNIQLHRGERLDDRVRPLSESLYVLYCALIARYIAYLQKNLES